MRNQKNPPPITGLILKIIDFTAEHLAIIIIICECLVIPVATWCWHDSNVWLRAASIVFGLAVAVYKYHELQKKK